MFGEERIDPYWKLRPPGPTQADEICVCPMDLGLVLRARLTANPLCCVQCNGEVPPERIGFDAAFAERIAFWRRLYESHYYLWLDSGEYESWAAARLADPEGQVNRRGREIVAELNRTTIAYYGWFVDPDEPAVACPLCEGTMVERGRPRFRVCEECRILV